MWQKLSLRARINLLLAFVLALGLAINIARLVLEAAPRVQAEDQSVTRLAREFIETIVADLNEAPDPDARLDRIMGDLSRLRHVSIARHDGAVPDARKADRADDSDDPRSPPSWFVTLVHPETTSVKLPPRMALSLGARLTIVGREGDFAVSADGLRLWLRRLAEIGSREPDYVAVAERFLETPYLWGGRTSEGIDCSGLVQTGLDAAGIAAPRDSDMQEAALGEPVAADKPLRRGDLVFWKGHVGVMRDALILLHANGWHMKVVSEPLVEARVRIAATGGGEVTSVRKLSPLPTGEGQG